jgi:DNA-binding transcriptional ArsR family regulator
MVAAVRTISTIPDDSCGAGEQRRGNGDRAERMEFSKSKDYNEEAEIFKVLGHPVRLKIAAGLCAEECTVKIIWECLGLPQSTVSQHLAIMKNKGVITGKRDGNEVRYSVTNPLVRRVIEAMV